MSNELFVLENVQSWEFWWHFQCFHIGIESFQQIQFVKKVKEFFTRHHHIMCWNKTSEIQTPKSLSTDNIKIKSKFDNKEL